MNEQDWTGFHIEQAYRAAMALRSNKSRLSWQELEHLKDAHRWLSGVLEKVEKGREEERHGKTA